MIPVYVADFETSYENGKSWVWCYGIARLNSDKVKLGGSLNEFMQHIMSSGTKTIYFHNLKFDGKFILYYLLKNDYEYTDKIEKEHQYTHLIDDTGNFYSITIGYKLKNKIHTIKIIDSYKILPSSLDKLASDFGLELSKQHMDYDIVRYENHILSADEENYIKHDVLILKQLIELSIENGIKKITIGSNALYDYKNIINSMNGLNFEMIFPHLDDNIDGFLRKAYKGGCTMLNKRFSNKVVDVYSYDVNSMYPTQLRYMLMPYGYPSYYKGKYVYDEKYPLYIQHIKAEFYIKENKVPCIQIKGSKFFAETEWLEKSDYVVDLYLTNMDLELFLESYDVYNLEYIDGYKFKGHFGMFSKYIDKWYDIKKNSKNKSMVAIAKLHLNSLYGKFGTRPVKKSLTFELVDNKIKRKEVITRNVRTVYLPIAIYVTSYARCFLINCINKNYDNFIYCDTDSIHLNKPAKDIPLDDKNLGCFKFEYKGKGKYLKQKCYLIHYDEEYVKIKDGKRLDKKLVCAGLSQNLLQENDLNFDNFYVGREYVKLKQVNVEGGVYLLKQIHKIT